MYAIGTIFKAVREEKGLSQLDVCGGICDKGTLSRIERDKQYPNRFLLAAISERLGLEAQKFFGYIGDVEDIKIDRLLTEVENLITRSCNDEAEKRLDAFVSSYNLNGEFYGQAENGKDKPHVRLLQQRVLWYRAAIAQDRKNYAEALLLRKTPL